MHERAAEHFDFKGVSREQHTISLQLDGPLALEFAYNGERQSKTVRPGELFTIPPRIPLSLNGKGEGYTISVTIQDRLFALAQAQLGLVGAASVRFVLGVDDPLARELILTLREEARKGRIGNGNYAEALAGTLTSHLIQNYSEHGTPNADGPGLSKAQLRRVIDFIHENLPKRVSLGLLARQANLSVYHFARLFKQSTGFSPHEYVNRLRVERAKDLLLREPSANTSQIARQVGFCDQSHLGRHFRRVAGISPREFLRSSPSFSQA